MVTFTLALRAQRMLRRNALIRKLPAVETLGSVTTICSDKTGTLTENRMTVTVVDGMLEISSRVWNDDHAEPLTPEWRERVQAANDRMAQNGMRVLGVGFHFQGALDDGRLETDLVFVGLFGMIDPPRPEVRLAVQTCQTAGLRPMMITGDHPLTASFIARDLGITADERVVTGQQLNALTPAQLEETVATVSVYARVSPEHKLRIVEALQRRGQIVAMTGDGVNDAPALKKADIGVAMGITGSDVSKEAADMVLRDDNFATIVAAVREGRVIYDNVRRFIKFSIAGNVGKVAVMLLAPLLGINVALLPLQLLWLNLLTDGLLGLGLGVEPAEKNVMSRPPQSPSAGIFSEGLGVHVLWVGALIGVVSLGVGWWYYHQGLPQWQTMIFTTLAFLQIGQALATRSIRQSFFSLGPLSNRLLLALALLVIGLQLAVIYLPGLEDFFGVTALSGPDLALSVGLGSSAFVALEIEKYFLRRRRG